MVLHASAMPFFFTLFTTSFLIAPRTASRWPIEQLKIEYRLRCTWSIIHFGYITSDLLPWCLILLSLPLPLAHVCTDFNVQVSVLCLYPACEGGPGGPAGMAEGPTCSLRPRCRERQWAEGGGVPGSEAGRRHPPNPPLRDTQIAPKKTKVTCQHWTCVKGNITEEDVRDGDGHLAGARAEVRFSSSLSDHVGSGNLLRAHWFKNSGLFNFGQNWLLIIFWDACCHLVHLCLLLHLHCFRLLPPGWLLPISSLFHLQSKVTASCSIGFHQAAACFHSCLLPCHKFPN